MVSYNEEGRARRIARSIFTKSLPSIVTRMIGGFKRHGARRGKLLYADPSSARDREPPLCYHSAYDRRTFAAIHLLEDLVATKSATFCNHKTYVTRAMADDMIDLLAVAARPFLRRSDTGGTLPVARELSPMVHHRCGENGHRSITPGRHLTPLPALFRLKIMARRDEVWPATMRALALHDSEPQGLIHSDVHIGNWYRDGRRPEWGCATGNALSRGHWSRDFAYAVTASLTPDDRRNWERDLLARLASSGSLTKPASGRTSIVSFLRYRQLDRACARDVDDHAGATAAVAEHAAGGHDDRR